MPSRSTQPALHPDAIFLRLAQVVVMAGISKTEIYRQIEAGRFPRNRSFPDNPARKFWLRSDIAAWQRRIIQETGGDEYEDLVG